MPTKTIVKRLQKTCACCAKAIRVIAYSPAASGILDSRSRDKSDYRGGHFFGKLPLYTKKEEARADSFGFTKKLFGKIEVLVMNKDPKPYGYVEYWECPKCYWRG
jgi:hypothetical protein